MSSVFLSHNSKDKPWVRKLADRLTADGVVVWIDEAELNIGDSLIEKIAAGIQNMRFVAAIISSNSVGSSWVQKELNLAMTKEIKGKTVTVLPLMIESCVLPNSLIDKLYADFTQPENYEREYSKLLRAIGIHKNIINTTEKSINKVAVIQDIKSQELRIIGVLKDRTRQDSRFGGLQNYYFQLSKHPPLNWAQYFENARSFPRHNMWRSAWIEGDCVVVKCALEEIERYHLRDLKEDVATANAQFSAAALMKEEQDRQRRAIEDKNKQLRDGKLDNLSFD